jgi:glycine betaine catabolism B
MGLIRPITLEYVDRKVEDGAVTSFSFRPTKPLKHVAGQHGLLTLQGAGMKAFSLASGPEDDEVLIGTKLASGSTFKTALAALQPGDTVQMRGPIRKFTLDGSADDVVLLAQGVGITPYRSILRHIAATGMAKNTTLLHVGTGHAYRSDTEPLATRALYSSDSETFRLDLKHTYTDQPDATYFLSGAPAFIKETAAVLVEAGIPTRRLKKDMFRGY